MAGKILRSVWVWLAMLVLGVGFIGYLTTNGPNENDQDAYQTDNEVETSTLPAVDDAELIKVPSDDTTIAINDSQIENTTQSLDTSRELTVDQSSGLDDQGDVTDTSEIDDIAPKTIPILETARVDPDGAVLLAGRGDVESTLEILLDGVPIETVTVGPDGNFVAMFDLSASDLVRTISIRTLGQDTIVYSDQDLVILPSQITLATQGQNEGIVSSNTQEEISLASDIENAPANNVELASEKQKSQAASAEQLVTDGVSEVDGEKQDVEIVESASDSDNSILDQDDNTASLDAQNEQATQEPLSVSDSEISVDTQTASELVKNELNDNLQNDSENNDVSNASTNTADSTKIDQAVSQTVVIADSDGVKIIQDEQNNSPKIQSKLILDSIAYDPQGGVKVSGRGHPNGFIRFYLDNTAFTSTLSDGSGYWSADLTDAAPGVYTLRIDGLSLDGKVLSRLESPFKRENREKLAEIVAPSATLARINVVTVQPGNTLWAIARKRYGDGILYVHVFEANRDKIRNPDLIYPGQIFDLPDLNETDKDNE